MQIKNHEAKVAPETNAVKPQSLGQRQVVTMNIHSAVFLKIHHEHLIPQFINDDTGTEFCVNDFVTDGEFEGVFFYWLGWLIYKHYLISISC